MGGSALTVFLVVIVLVAADRTTQQNHATEQNNADNVGHTGQLAQEIVGNHLGGLIPPEFPPPSSKPMTTDSLVVPITDDNEWDAPPLPDGKIGLPQTPINTVSPKIDSALQERIRSRKIEQFEAALAAKTTVPTPEQRSKSAPPSHLSVSQDRNGPAPRLELVQQQIASTPHQDPSSAYPIKMAQLQAALSGNTSGGGPMRLPRSSDILMPRDTLIDINKAGSSDRWRLPSITEAPRTPYELRAGFVVPATLISGINSDLSGQVIAQVSQNVYDTPTGRYLLIPLGSRLVGGYTNDIIYGQARVMMAWQRIVFPDGKALDIGSMPGTDAAGKAGFADQVNHHYWRVMGSAFLMSFITAGVEVSQNSDNDERRRASDALSEALGQQLGSAMTQMISKNLNISPTLEIRPGYRFNVMVNKDMAFSRPYQAFDY
jgi:type IV secretion system protein VirB10